MLIKLLVSRAGVNFSQSAGEVLEIENAEAVRMIAVGQAEQVGKSKKYETATKKFKGSQ